MTDLDIKRVDGTAGDEELEAWRYVHNTIIPTHLLSLADVRERAERHHLELAYVDGVLVGNSTVRLPEGDTATATVIARVLAEHRKQGFGEQLYERALRRAGNWAPGWSRPAYWNRTRTACGSRSTTVSRRPSAICWTATRSSGSNLRLHEAPA